MQYVNIRVSFLLVHFLFPQVSGRRTGYCLSVHDIYCWLSLSVLLLVGFRILPKDRLDELTVYWLWAVFPSGLCLAQQTCFQGFFFCLVRFFPCRTPQLE